MRILLADDHAIVLEGLEALLRPCRDLEVVATVASGSEAVTVAKQTYPHVVVMDIGMRHMNGIEATRCLRRCLSHVRVVMLSMYCSPEHVLEALRAGACGFVAKTDAPESLAVAIRAAARGQAYLSPSVARPVIDGYLRHADGGPKGRLTPQERIVLQLTAEGQTARQIAGILGVSPKTVDTHRAHVMEKLDLHDIPALVRFALRSGMVEAD